MHPLEQIFKKIHKKSYKAYKELTKKTFTFENYSISFDHIQGDPFAGPSKITASVPLAILGIPEETYNNTIKSIAFRDALSRVFAKNVHSIAAGNRGSGGSGSFTINNGTQKILNRNSVVFGQNRENKKSLLFRVLVGLPAYGRRIAGDQAVTMFFDELPRIIEKSTLWKNLDHEYFFDFVEIIQKQEKIRQELRDGGLIAFIADNSILPRRSGVDDRPLKNGVPFKSPESMRITVSFNEGTEVTGMGIKEGVTIITGGGFHGKSTLLNAIQAGIYNHIPGDGREFVISIPELVKIRAEDGRNIEKVDISTFINNLPEGRDTVSFSTPNASGSTSQAANIMESLEIGAKCIIMDEDTCATNFLIRDKRMQELIPASKEPITPYIDVARPLYEQKKVSTIFVVGGSGDYIDIADFVIMLDRYYAHDATRQAREIAQQFPFAHINRFSGKIQLTSRYPRSSSINPSKGKRNANIKTRDNKILFGRDEIDLSSWEHIVDPTQLATIGDILLYGVMNKVFNEDVNIRDFIDTIMDKIDNEGFDCIFKGTGQNWSYYCQLRPLDIAAALNRLRTLSVSQ